MRNFKAKQVVFDKNALDNSLAALHKISESDRSLDDIDAVKDIAQGYIENPNEDVEEKEMPERDCYHIKSFSRPTSDNSSNCETYFSDKFQSMENITFMSQIGRECYFHSESANQLDPLFIFACKDFPLSIRELFPFFDFFFPTSQTLPEIKRFFLEQIDGFPVRFQTPVMKILNDKVEVELKISLIEFKNDLQNNLDFEKEYNVIKDYDNGKILPIFFTSDF
jgi:hypothetical protein